MQSIQIKAYAKVNLSLDILGVSGKLHILDSIATSVDLADVVCLQKRQDKNITIKMRGQGLDNLAQEKNNAYIAAQNFMQEFATCGVDIDIEKQIPTCAGLGGSAADAAAVICGMQKLYKIKNSQRVNKVCARTSSDCLFMTKGGFGRILGVGDIVKPIKTKQKLYFLALLVPGGVSTKECFALYDKMPKNSINSSDLLEKMLVLGDFDAICANISNKLLPAASIINSQINQAISQLSSLNAQAVSMTGSGSCVFAVFDSLDSVKAASNKYSGAFDKIILKSL